MANPWVALVWAIIVTLFTLGNWWLAFVACWWFILPATVMTLMTIGLWYLTALLMALYYGGG